MAITVSNSSSCLFTSTAGRRQLEEELLPQYLPCCRWFGAKARAVKTCRLLSLLPISEADDAVRLACIEVGYFSGDAESYLLPLTFVGAGLQASMPEEARVALFGDGWMLVDAIHDRTFRTELMRLITEEASLHGDGGAQVTGIRGSAAPAGSSDSRVLKVEQSNSSILFGDHTFLKLFRKLVKGSNPDVEITRFLSERCGFAHSPPFVGAIELRMPGSEPQVLALALGLVPNEGDAWACTLNEVEKHYRLCLAAGPADRAMPAFAARASQLGKRTGELHVALASEAHDPAFAPESFTAEEQRAMGETLEKSIDQVIDFLRFGHSKLGVASAPLAQKVIDEASELHRRARSLATEPVDTVKIRTHGDYHLGQVLNTGSDFVIIDFEGEPLRSLAERREKRSPLRDVAGMLRSFHYAAHSGLNQFPGERQQLEAEAENWAQIMSAQFLRGWREAAKGQPFVPISEDQVTKLLDAFILEKAIYEVSYELNNRPSWVGIPLRGILQILSPTA